MQAAQEGDLAMVRFLVQTVPMSTPELNTAGRSYDGG